ncbi:unnamed protein product [Cuscuta europaea]|uniref:Uncharacterized protein n=1 Tax=Cuscuta europaea TaxID=41803 RepID=A0A9P1E7Z0_CUSEU|nr:unnamed protein product [Cuscuta europaea]
MVAANSRSKALAQPRIRNEAVWGDGCVKGLHRYPSPGAATENATTHGGRAICNALKCREENQAGILTFRESKKSLTSVPSHLYSDLLDFPNRSGTKSEDDGAAPPEGFHLGCE